MSTTTVDRDAVLAYLKSLEGRKLSQKAMAKELGVSEKSFRVLYRDLIEDGDYTPPDPSSSPALATDPEPVLLPDGQPPGIRSMTLDQLDLDAGTRVRELDEMNLQNMEELLTDTGSTDVLPPLRAFYVPDLDRNVLSRGFHRYEASYRVLGPEASWKVDLHQGSLREAIEDAMQDNRTHGLALTRQQREQIVLRLLTEGHWVGWNDVAIAKAAGERDPKGSGRKFVARVRKDWHKEQGKKDREETRKAQRNGVTYDQKMPRGKPDQAEGDELPEDQEDQEDQTEERKDTAADRKKQVEQEYLMAIPMRSQLHPDLIPAFDQAALFFHSLDHSLRTLQNGVLANQAVLGPQHPLISLVARVVRIPAPITVGDDLVWRHPWTACQACVEDGKTTGVNEDGTPCAKCSGTGILFREKRN